MTNFRAIFFVCVLMGIMAVADLYFSLSMKAMAHDLSHMHTDHMTAPMLAVEAEASHDLVADALNSRYMQWGAVGVMLGLFVWLITCHLPRQDKLRREESDLIRGSFLESIHKRDAYFLEDIRDIRVCVEAHTERLLDAKEKQAEALTKVAMAVDNLQRISGNS